MDPARGILPLALSEATDEQRRLMGPWSDMHFAAVYANHPGLYRVVMPLIKQVVVDSTLPTRDREILLFRTLHLCEDVYESTHHREIARSAGMTDVEIDAARTGEGLSGFDATLANAAEQLVRHQRVGDETWRELGERYRQAQMMEVVALVGTYVLIAMSTRTFGIAIEDDETFRGFMDKRDYLQRERGTARG